VHPVEQTETASAARLRRIASAHLLDDQLDHNQHGVTAPSLNKATMHGKQLAHGGTLRGVRIRTKDSGDTAACIRLVTEIHRTDGYPQPLPADPAAFVTPSYETVAWVAESDGRIIGHVALHHPALDPTLQVAQRVTGLSPNRLALVARLLVDPTRRRLGLGGNCSPQPPGTPPHWDNVPFSTSFGTRARRSRCMRRLDGSASTPSRWLLMTARRCSYGSTSRRPTGTADPIPTAR